MNLNISENAKITFDEAIADSPVVRSWLMNRLSAYSSKDLTYFLYISLDTFSKSDKPSFDWSIWSCADKYADTPFSEGKQTHVITGGLIYRDLDENGNHSYSSHT